MIDTLLTKSDHSSSHGIWLPALQLRRQRELSMECPSLHINQCEGQVVENQVLYAQRSGLSEGSMSTMLRSSKIDNPLRDFFGRKTSIYFLSFYLWIHIHHRWKLLLMQKMQSMNFHNHEKNHSFSRNLMKRIFGSKSSKMLESKNNPLGDFFGGDEPKARSLQPRPRDGKVVETAYCERYPSAIEAGS